MKNLKSLCPSIEDILVLILFVSILVSNRMNGDEVSAHLFDNVYVIVAGYYLSRLLITVNQSFFHDAIIISVQLWTVFEALKGILQIIGVVSSNNMLFACTGSFDNPGPYGGFLAVGFLVSVFWLLKKGKALSWVSVILCCVVLPSTQSRAALVAILASAVAYLALNTKARSFAVKYWKPVALLVIVACVAVFAFKRQSASGRLFINRMNVRTMVDNGMHGVGMGHFSSAYGNSQMAYFAERIEFTDSNVVYDESDAERHVADAPNAPFNDYLRVGIEFGLWPMLLFVLLCGVSVRHLRMAGSPLLYGLVAMMVFMLFSYPLSEWQFLTVMIICMAYGASVSGKERVGLIRVGLPCVLSLLFVCMCVPKLRPLRECRKDEKAWENLRYLHEAKNYDNYEYCCSQLYDTQQYNCAFMYEYAYSLFMNRKYEESRDVAQKGLKLSCNPLLYILMGDLDKAQDRIISARQEYEKAFMIQPDRLYPLSKIAILYHDIGDTVRFMNMVNCIREFKPRVESALTRQIRFEIDQMVWNSGTDPE